MISEVVTSKIIHTSTIAEVPDQPRAVPAVVGFARLPYRGFYVTSVVRPRASACETTEGDDALISSIQPEGYIRVSLVIWWFESSQPLRIISGLQRHIVERTNEAEIRREEQSERAEICREDLGNEIQLKGL